MGPENLPDPVHPPRAAPSLSLSRFFPVNQPQARCLGSCAQQPACSTPRGLSKETSYQFRGQFCWRDEFFCIQGFQKDLSQQAPLRQLGVSRPLTSSPTCRSPASLERTERTHPTDHWEEKSLQAREATSTLQAGTLKPERGRRTPSKSAGSGRMSWETPGLLTPARV